MKTPNPILIQAIKFAEINDYLLIKYPFKPILNGQNSIPIIIKRFANLIICEVKLGWIKHLNICSVRNCKKSNICLNT